MYEPISPTFGPEYYTALQKVLLTVGILCVISTLLLALWLAAVLMYGLRHTNTDTCHRAGFETRTRGPECHARTP